jgi:hypothetical protein
MKEQEIENVYYNVAVAFKLAMQSAHINLDTIDSIMQTVEDAVVNHFDELTVYNEV